MTADNEVEPSSYFALIALGKKDMQLSACQFLLQSQAVSAICRHLLRCWHNLRGFSTSTRSLEGSAPEEAGQNSQKTRVFA